MPTASRKRSPQAAPALFWFPATSANEADVAELFARAEHELGPIVGLVPVRGGGRAAHGGAGGAIVNVSSRASSIGGAGEWVHYAASKGAIDTFTRGLALEVADDGIRVNAVSPGLIDTAIHASGRPDRLAALVPSVPLGRAGTAKEVAEAIPWLLSPSKGIVCRRNFKTGLDFGEISRVRSSRHGPP